MASLRQYAYALGVILFIAGLILIPFSAGEVTQQAAILIVVGGALVLGTYFYGWLSRHPLATIVIVVVALMILYVFLPSLSPAGPRFAPTAPTTVGFPSGSDASGTNCAATDAGTWTQREQAFEDSSPNTDSTSARADGNPVGAPCDDWTGFGFALDEHAVTRVLVTIEYQIANGTAQLRVAPWTSRGPTECEAQSTTILSGPSAYQVDTFDFTGCKNWNVTDFNNNAFGVTVEAVPQVQSTIFMDYVKVTVEQEGEQQVSPLQQAVLTAEQRAGLEYALGISALAAGIIAGGLWLFGLRRTKWFRYALVAFALLILAWFLLSYVVS